MTMAEWKPIIGIQTILNLGEKELDSRAFIETSAQWLDYNINNNKLKWEISSQIKKQEIFQSFVK